jgi:hypothetical protein
MSGGLTWLLLQKKLDRVIVFSLEFRGFLFDAERFKDLHLKHINPACISVHGDR